jgi:hypothetical protein
MSASRSSLCALASSAESRSGTVATSSRRTRLPEMVCRSASVTLARIARTCGSSGSAEKGMMGWSGGRWWVERRITGVSLGSNVALAQGKKFEIDLVGEQQEIMKCDARRCGLMGGVLTCAGAVQTS